MYYLDTNTVIYFLNGRYESIRKHILETPPMQIRIPTIVKAELLGGAYGSQQKEANLEKLNLFLKPFLSEPFDNAAAESYAAIYADLKRKGTPIGPYDTLIAATALAHDGVIVTHNTKEFSRIPRLQVVDWAEE